MNTTFTSTDKPLLNVSPIDDLKQAASKMLGAERRSFEAAMALKYCQGNARQAELVFGWSRHSVELGLHERRSGIICLGAQAAFCGNKWWDVSGGVNSGQFGQFEIRDGRDWVKRVQSGFSGGSLAFDDDGFGLAELNRAVATCVGMAPGERGR